MSVEWEVEQALSARVDLATKQWKQGDAFAQVPLVRVADADNPLTGAAHRAHKDGRTGIIALREILEWGAIVTQTCDLVRPCGQRPHVHIAAVVQLRDQELLEAARGWRPRYSPAPWIGPDWFIDFDRQSMVEKSVLMSCGRGGGPTSPAEERHLARALARHRERHAFPDDVAICLKPVIDRLRSKAGKATPQGRRVDEVVEIRLGADPDWEHSQIDLEVIFVVDQTSLPPVADSDDEATDALGNIGEPDAQRAAEMLERADGSALLRSALWQHLAARWIDSARTTDTIATVTSRAVSVGEFTRLDELAAPQLDLDYLSES